MSITDITSLITALGAVIGVIAAAFYCDESEAINDVG